MIALTFACVLTKDVIIKGGTNLQNVRVGWHRQEFGGPARRPRQQIALPVFQIEGLDPLGRPEGESSMACQSRRVGRMLQTESWKIPQVERETRMRGIRRLWNACWQLRGKTCTDPPMGPHANGPRSRILSLCPPKVNVRNCDLEWPQKFQAGGVS